MRYQGDHFADNFFAKNSGALAVIMAWCSRCFVKNLAADAIENNIGNLAILESMILDISILEISRENLGIRGF